MALIQLEQVSKEFTTKSGRVTAVDNVSLTVEAGEIYGIVGYSGAGKSTLVRLLNGLEIATAGQVRIHSQDIGTLTNKELRQFRQKIGMIFQHFNLLWSRTVQENIELPLEISGLGKEERQKRARELVELVGLTGREAAYPSQLSGGQKQRVGIARALANDPEILLCDEGTSALDPQTTDEVLDLLATINQKLGVTIVLITHEMHVIRKICHKMAVMEAGKLVEEGRVIDVFRQPQQEVTKRFVQQETVTDFGEEEHPLEMLAKQFSDATVVKLTFMGGSSEEPVMSQTIRQFDVEMNIIQGQIQPLQHGALGTLIIGLTGPDVQAALTYIKSCGVEVEEAQDDQ